MKRPMFSFRPNLKNEEHRRAWDILQSVPDGKKGSFLVQAILENVGKNDLETTLRKIIREELQMVSFQPVKQQEDVIPQQMMGFLDSLLDQE